MLKFITRQILCFGLALATICAATLPVGSTYATESCDDIRLIFVRGSGAQIDDDNYFGWRDEMNRVLENTPLKYSFYNVGTTTQDGYRYPAIAVGDSPKAFLDAIGALIGQGEWFAYGNSVKQGVGELTAYIKNTSATCPNMKYVIGGYSQGAQVISTALPKIPSDKIIYATTFGDPKIYLPEGKAEGFVFSRTTPAACRGENFSPYRAYVPNCRVYEGVLGSNRPYQPESYLDKLGAWCAGNDIMCTYGMSADDHMAYLHKNLYRDAAKVTFAHIQKAFPKIFWPEIFNNPTEAPSISMPLSKVEPPKSHTNEQLAIVIDTTDSMEYMLAHYVPSLQKLNAEIHENGGEVAVIDFRDIREGYAPKLRCSFSCSVEEVNAWISGLPTGGGGDIYESTLSALKLALTDLDWKEGATKSILLISDAPLRDPDLDRTTLDDIVLMSRALDPVNIYALLREDYTAGYDALTEQTNGGLFRHGLEDFSEIADAILNRPEARLGLSEYIGYIGEDFIFDASASFAVDDHNSTTASEHHLTYDWDLDGDLEFEIQNGSSIIHHVYHEAVDTYIQVRVTDENGHSATMSAHLLVTDSSATPAPASITNLTATPASSESVTVDFLTNAEKVMLVINDVPLGFVPLNSEAGEDDSSIGTFSLTNLSLDTNVTLVPYANSSRGLPYSVKVFTAPDPSEATTSPNEELPSEPNDQPSDSPELSEPSSPSEPSVPSNPSTPSTPSNPSTTQPAISHSSVSSRPTASSTSTTNEAIVAVIDIPEAPASGSCTSVSCYLNVNLDANGRRIRTYKRLVSAHHNHTELLVPPLPLLHVWHNKPYADLQPSISSVHTHHFVA